MWQPKKIQRFSYRLIPKQDQLKSFSSVEKVINESIANYPRLDDLKGSIKGMFMLYISYDLNLADTVSSEHLSFKDAEGISKKLSVSYSYYYDLFEFLSAPKIFVSLIVFTSFVILQHRVFHL